MFNIQSAKHFYSQKNLQSIESTLHDPGSLGSHGKKMTVTFLSLWDLEFPRLSHFFFFFCAEQGPCLGKTLGPGCPHVYYLDTSPFFMLWTLVRFGIPNAAVLRQRCLQLISSLGIVTYPSFTLSWPCTLMSFPLMWVIVCGYVQVRWAVVLATLIFKGSSMGGAQHFPERSTLSFI